MNKETKKTIFLLIILVLVSTILLTGGFIYTTYDDKLDQDNMYVKAGLGRTGLYIMFGIASLFIFTLFWGFIISSPILAGN